MSTPKKPDSIKMIEALIDEAKEAFFKAVGDRDVGRTAYWQGVMCGMLEVLYIGVEEEA